MTNWDQFIWAHDPDVYAGRIALKWPLETWHWAHVRTGYCTISIWQRPNEHTQVAQRIGPHGVSDASLVRLDHAVASGLVVPKKPLTPQEIETTTYIRYGRLFRLDNFVIEDPPPNASGWFARYDLDDLSPLDEHQQVYTGRIVIAERDGWYRARLAEGHVTTCRIDQPNRHNGIYRLGADGFIDPLTRISIDKALRGGCIDLEERIEADDVDVDTDRVGLCGRHRERDRCTALQNYRERLGMLLR